MRVWLIQTGEPLPIDGEAPRLLRTGIMARALAERGHDVTWWCSTFNHWTKTHRYPSSTTVDINDRYRLRLLESPGYRRNVSLGRIIDHRILANNFEAEIRRQPRPDVILCSFPTIEMAEIAADFGREHGIPVIVDVRDIWPDAFLSVLPGMLQPVARVFCRGMYRQAARAMRNSDAIIGVSDGYLQWGLDLANRPRSADDRIFPLGYERASPSAAELAAAEKFLLGAGVDPERVICWFIGTFGRTYDVPTVIKAARALEDKHDHRAQFVLSGEGPSTQECREMARGLDNVVFTGWLNSSAIEWMMGTASVGLAAYTPGAPQGLPNKLFEYLSAGLAIVSSLGDEARELLEMFGCGFSYTPGDSESLVSVLTPLLDNPAMLSQTRDAARRAFAEHFSTERVYAPYLDYLEKFGVREPTPSLNS